MGDRVTARQLGGEYPMRMRLALAAGLALALVGCSMGPSAQSLSSGFSGNTAALPAPPKRPDSPSAKASLAVPQAKAGDRAPPGSFDVAPKGSLADRNYATTRLDADAARDAINAYRKQHGLRPLVINLELTRAARAHAADLSKWDRISHFGSDGSNPWDRVKRSGYNARLAAENVGTGQVTFDEVMKGWRESPGHNKNLLLADATHMGIALVHDPKTEFKTFWTLVLGAPM